MAEIIQIVTNFWVRGYFHENLFFYFIFSRKIHKNSVGINEKPKKFPKRTSMVSLKRLFERKEPKLQILHSIQNSLLIRINKNIFMSKLNQNSVV